MSGLSWDRFGSGLAVREAVLSQAQSRSLSRMWWGWSPETQAYVKSGHYPFQNRPLGVLKASFKDVRVLPV
jgi:hypothetical protein